MEQGKLIFDMNDSGECHCEYDEDALQLGIVIRKKSPSGYWYVRVEGFGWNRINGFAYVNQLTGKGWLRKILPDTECHFKIYHYGKGLLVQNFHHDSCSGDEKYYCVPISKKTFDNKSYEGSV
jgi:hypothetical protein